MRFWGLGFIWGSYSLDSIKGLFKGSQGLFKEDYSSDGGFQKRDPFFEVPSDGLILSLLGYIRGPFLQV